MHNDNCTEGGPIIKTFLSLPGSIDFYSSLRFSPSRGIIDPHSLKAELKVDATYISVDALHSLLTSLKDRHKFEPSDPPPTSAALTSVSEASASPMSPFVRVLRSVRLFPDFSDMLTQNTSP